MSNTDCSARCPAPKSSLVTSTRIPSKESKKLWTRLLPILATSGNTNGTHKTST